MTTDDEIIEKRLVTKPIMYFCPICNARILFKNNADKHEHKIDRIVEFSDKELKIMLKEARTDQTKKNVARLAYLNPYPIDIFLPRSKTEMKAVSDLIAKAGYSPDAVFGQLGRFVWKNAVQTLEEMVEVD